MEGAVEERLTTVITSIEEKLDRLDAQRNELREELERKRLEVEELERMLEDLKSLQDKF